MRSYDLLLQRYERVLDLIQLETGKVRCHAFEEILNTALVSRYYAIQAEKWFLVQPSRHGLYHDSHFVEIAEFGDVGTELYYEFLNLGFRLTAAGGRYTVGRNNWTPVFTPYTDQHFDVNSWFRSLKAGHTFVTLARSSNSQLAEVYPANNLHQRQDNH